MSKDLSFTTAADETQVRNPAIRRFGFSNKSRASVADVTSKSAASTALAAYFESVLAENADAKKTPVTEPPVSATVTKIELEGQLLENARQVDA